ncbi:MAG: antirestriction protein [Pseudomonadales bacterium RIFCSPLOWO2_02_FULL_63_210]|nr:MAG: antirestriction protein [Pseudomonadales bacterium RIFCSPLOWO2_02_FULL_63_210]
MSEHIRIYVADLAAYNAGHLHGAWIDATQDMDDIQAQVNAMLAASPVEGAEEYAIHDFEGFDGYPLGEYEGLQTAHEIACFIEEHPEFGGALLAHCNDLEEAQQAAEEDYCGCHASLADYAQELTEETTSIPQHLAQYIDYQAMARDMEYSGDAFTLETGFEQVHVFWNR